MQRERAVHDELPWVGMDPHSLPRGVGRRERSSSTPQHVGVPLENSVLKALVGLQPLKQLINSRAKSLLKTQQSVLHRIPIGCYRPMPRLKGGRKEVPAVDYAIAI